MRFNATLVLILIIQLAFGQDKRVQKIDSLLNSLDSLGLINGNFLIAEKGNIIYNNSFGYANEDTKELLNENSIFEVGSVSKQFTAMAIMMLKEKEKLNLDDTISKFIPELSFYKKITIRNLLNHTSGYPDNGNLLDSLYDKSKIHTNRDNISIYSKVQPKLLFEPNTKWEYSNMGYELLATIIENISGLTFANFMDSAIFKPLGMNNTFVYNRFASQNKIENYAFGYIFSDSLKKYVLPEDNQETNYVFWLSGMTGAGHISSTVIDLLKWDRALYTTKLISKESMNEILSPSILNDNTKTEYGFGWFLSENATYGKLAYHPGGWPGYTSLLERHLDNDKTIIILMNHEDVIGPLDELEKIIYNIPLENDTIIEYSKSKYETDLNSNIEKLTIYFKSGDYTLDIYSKNKIDSVLKIGIPENIKIESRCDSVGTYIFNDSLSLYRALAVKKYLLSKGINDSIIKIFALGKRFPLNDNKTEKERALNRCADILFLIKLKSIKKDYATFLNDSNIFDITNTPVGSSLILTNLNFFPGSVRLLPNAKRTLTFLKNTLDKYPSLEIEIQGYITGDSTSLPNIEKKPLKGDLSEMRAETVYKYLIKNGVNASRLSYFGYGIYNIADPRTESGQRENRRVEILIKKK